MLVTLFVVRMQKRHRLPDMLDLARLHDSVPTGSHTPSKEQDAGVWAWSFCPPDFFTYSLVSKQDNSLQVAENDAPVQIAQCIGRSSA